MTRAGLRNLVVVLLAAASRARGFVRKRLPGVTTDGAVGLQPFVTAVTAEVCIAASILSATAILVGRPPPA
ncbi:MAG: hypothetical protein ACRDYV_15330 [Acidimicrobiia bacterium]